MTHDLESELGDYFSALEARTDAGVDADDGEPRYVSRAQPLRPDLDPEHERSSSNAWRFAVAAAAVLVLAVGAVVVTSNGDDDGAPVAAGPGTSTTSLGGLQPFAPSGAEWYVSSYQPGSGDQDATYVESFEYAGRSWELTALDASRLDDVESHIGEHVDHVETDDGTSVAIVKDPTNPDLVYQAYWTTSAGVLLGLFGYSPAAAEIVTPTDDQSKMFETLGLPPIGDVLALVPTIGPIGDDAWMQAIEPPEGEPDPPSSSTTTRPLRLGLDATPDRTTLSLAPWTTATSQFEVDGFPSGTFTLTTTTDTSSVLRPTTASNIPVRGVTGDLDSRIGTRLGLPSIGQPTGMSGPQTQISGQFLTWDEGGSVVQLEFRNEATIDDAVALANGLVLLDEAQWQALLFPNRYSDISPTTTTMASPSTNETSTTTASDAAVSGVDAFCEQWKPMNAKAGGNYLNSPEHLQDLKALQTVAPAEIAAELQTYIDYVSAVVEHQAAGSTDQVDYPPEVQLAAQSLDKFTGDNCGPGTG